MCATKKTERAKIATTLDADLFEQLKREAYSRDIPLSALLDDVLTTRYYTAKSKKFSKIPDVKNRFMPPKYLRDNE